MIQAQNAKTVLVLAPKSGTAVSSATFDTLGADYATVRVALASEINTNATGPAISLAEADTSNSTAFATITADRAAEDITNAKFVQYNVDLRTRKRYLKLTVTPATTTNDTAVVYGEVVLSRLEAGPSSTSGMVGSTNDAVVMV